MSEPKRPASDAEWYCRKDPEADRFYEIFFFCENKTQSAVDIIY